MTSSPTLEFFSSLLAPFKGTPKTSPTNSQFSPDSPPLSPSLDHDMNDSFTDAPRSPVTVDQLKALGAQDLNEWKAERAARATATANGHASNNVTNGSPADPATATAIPAPPPPPPKSFQPIPLGGPRSTENTQRLHQLCQPRGVTPKFSYEPAGQRWTATLQVGSTVIESEGTFATHGEAKEHCATRACGIVAVWPVLGKQRIEEEGEVEENWVGMLGEFSQSALRSQPSYQHYQLSHQTFSATATLPGFPGAPDFGSVTREYNTKKAAKAGAARDAVVWLRRNKHLPTPGADGAGAVGKENWKGYEKLAKGLPKQKYSPPPPAKKVKTNEDTITTNGNTTTAANTSPTPSPSSDAQAQQGKPLTFGQQAQALRERLGLPSPTYHVHILTHPSLYEGWATFPNAAALPQLLQGERLAEVSKVFGQKNAREAIARGLVQLMGVVLAEREREAEVVVRMVEG